jgi:hypothetical protein
MGGVIGTRSYFAGRVAVDGLFSTMTSNPILAVLLYSCTVLDE